jgi:non-specific serine/threonine protein kinase
MWLVAGSKVFAIDGNPELIRAHLSTGGVTIPQEDEPRFLESYLPVLAERAQISGDLLASTRELTVEPVTRVYLSESDGELAVELRFAYDGYEVPFQKSMPEISTKCDSEARELVRIHRDKTSEERSWREMSCYGLKRATGGESFLLRSNTSPVDFLIHHVPKMVEAGCEIYGEDEIKSVRVNRNRPRVSISVSSGIDWFDVKAVVNFGDLEVPLGDIRKAVKKREKYVKLCDGSIGEIPMEWIERYKHLFDLAGDHDEGMRLSKSQIMLLDAAIADAESVQTDDLFGQSSGAP